MYYKNLIIILLIVIILPSCSENFIDLAPPSDINSSSFYKSKEDIELAVNAAYSSLQSNGMFNQGLYYFGEMRSDNTECTWLSGSSFDKESIYTFKMNSANTYIHTVWNDMYNMILRCNLVLDRIEAVEMNEDLKNQYKGEVSFLRGLTYFYLVRLFGGVPLVLTEINVDESYVYGRASVDEIYSQIILDLKNAEGWLPNRDGYDATDVGRATSGAAQGILAKVYLTRKDYQNAKTYLEKVMAQGYELLPDYAQLWDLQHENSVESIFEVQYKKGGTGTGSPFANNFAPRFSENRVVPVGGTGSENSPTPDMEEAYEPGDLRKDISMAPGFLDENGDLVRMRYVKKYMDTPFADDDSDNNWPVLRYADVLLMYAEVLNELGFQPNGQAFDLLNQIRDRAGLPHKTSDNSNPDLKVSNQEEFRLAIEHERRVELAFENHRWFDLLRTDRMVEVMSSKGYNVSEEKHVLPIPLEVIESNPEKMTQNPGYN